ncbi:ABC transporter substrate-binding protein [Pandoraea sp. NPDC087047]|uniref:ABC transporter substrate-binding protein n=1 Tax=Pandoraea sp. NPDC087047 TaxID=3364390 RepID=UPI0037F642A8
MKQNLVKLSGLIACAVTIFGVAINADAAELRIGLSKSISSVDPMFYVGGGNSALARSIFDSLVIQSESQTLIPGLAVSWRAIGDREWEFKLRPHVKFHDGSAFGAQDVAASIRRVAQVSVGSPSSFLPYVKDIVGIDVIDDLTIRFRTKAPAPLLPSNLSRISILPRADESLRSSDLNEGRGVIGTGPFKFVEWRRDDALVLQRNPDYWAGPAQWDKVTLRFMPTDGSRVAGFLGRDVDVIEDVPTPDVKRLQRDANVQLVTAPSNRVLYLHPDQDRLKSPFASAPDGTNPLRLLAVRRAMALAINKRALIDRISDGQGVIADQLVPKGYFGWSPSVKAIPYDPDAARALLKSVGLEGKMTLTFHASNDRYPNDAAIAQALGQMWAKVGIRTQIVTLPGNVYFSRAAKRDFSLIMGGAAIETGEASGVLGPLLATYGPDRGQGNRGRYANPAFDRALNEALVTIDTPKRERLLQSAMEIGMNDLGVIPLFFLTNNWALRKGLTYVGRADGYTLPYYVRSSH